ncbi:hypothetical protein C8F01DRAFT_1234147 [Mycena amicta]|nr:hypothetical protein C8F01DRAFT_1234147 [Mycena amicta]
MSSLPSRLCPCVFLSDAKDSNGYKTHRPSCDLSEFSAMSFLSPPEKSSKAPVGEDDHRKKRRNRTIQSCLNCHATKRMCDRKRPCSRCAQLGLTGTCVYEVQVDGGESNVVQHESAPRPQPGEDSAKMRARIAELESFVRELKNKPPPRGSARPAAASASIESASRQTHQPSWPTPSLYSGASHSAFIPQPQREYQVGGASDDATLDSLLFTTYAGLDFDTGNRHGHGGATSPRSSTQNCNCISDGPCYNALLALSFRLRTTKEALARSTSHAYASPGSNNCRLQMGIDALDRLLKKGFHLIIARSSLDAEHISTSAQNGHSYADLPHPHPAHQPQLQFFNGGRIGGENHAYGSDDFMSWNNGDGMPHHGRFA